jgi:hypothetical protein
MTKAVKLFAILALVVTLGACATAQSGEMGSADSTFSKSQNK